MAKQKLKDLGRIKSGERIRTAIKKAEESGNRRFYADLRLKQKAANERMRQLEKQDIKSPAYQAIQAKLELMGKQRKGDRGRRFSETGKATYNEQEYLNRILDEFLGQKTSKVSGAKEYYDEVWSTADSNLGLSKAGITKEQWFEFWDNMPDKKKDRMFYSQQVKIFKAFMRKNGNLIDEGKLTIADVAESIQESKYLSEVLGKLDITLKEVTKEND